MVLGGMDAPGWVASPLPFPLSVSDQCTTRSYTYVARMSKGSQNLDNNLNSTSGKTIRHIFFRLELIPPRSVSHMDPSFPACLPLNCPMNTPSKRKNCMHASMYV